MHRYVWRELVRNPRRTLAATAGVVLGVALFSGVLFFSDGSGATLTARAVEPLALDMQRVLTSPLGSGLRLREQVGAAGSIAAGEQVTVTLRLSNDGAEPAHDVVVQDEAPRPLRYVPGSATLNGARLGDVGGGSPLSQGVAGLGRNIGTVAPGATVAITYRARAVRSVHARELRLGGRVSSRESLVPAAANGPRHLTLEQVRARIASIPGVASADGLAFVDLPAGTLQGARRRRAQPRARVRVRLALPGPLPVDPSRRRIVRRGRRGAQCRGLARARSRAGWIGYAAPPGRAGHPPASQRRRGPDPGSAAVLEPPLAQPRSLPVRTAGDRRHPCRVRPHDRAGAARRERGARRDRQEPARRGGRRARRAGAAARGSRRGARADPRGRPLDRADRAPAGLPHRQHLEHAHRGARRCCGRQADVPVPRPSRHPAGGRPGRLCGGRAGRGATPRAGQSPPARSRSRPPPADARLSDARRRRRGIRHRRGGRLRCAPSRCSARARC